MAHLIKAERDITPDDEALAADHCLSKATDVQTSGRRIHLNTKACLTRLESWPSLYPEEVVTLVLFAVTIIVNVVVHHTLNASILFATVHTYRTIFAAFVMDFFRALGYCLMAYGAWQFLQFIAGRPVDLVVWRRTGKLWTAARALVVYWLCNMAFLNLDSFVHVLSPLDRDAWLIAVDKALFFGHHPLKLLEPLVAWASVRFFAQVYFTLYLVPLVAMIIFLHQAKLRAFHDTILSLAFAVAIGWPIYLLVPAIGPYYVQRDLFSWDMWNVAGTLQEGTDRLSRATFPSLHTGISVTVLILVWHHSTSPLFRIAFTLWVAGIVFSTMYLRLHYVIDVIAGIGLAILVAYLGPRVNDWYLATDSPEGCHNSC